MDAALAIIHYPGDLKVTRKGYSGFVPASCRIGGQAFVLVRGLLKQILRLVDGHAHGLSAHLAHQLLGGAELRGNLAIPDEVIDGHKSEKKAMASIYLV